MRLLILATILVAYTSAAKFVEQVSKSAISVLHGSRTEIQVRQCTCEEMIDCYASAKKQALDCFEGCWQTITAFKLTDRPDKLKACVDAKMPFADQVINCFQHRVKACSEGPTTMLKVNQYNYLLMIRNVEEAINEQVQAFLRSIGSDAVKTVINAATTVAKCVKTCFVQKNRDGFCFNRIGCEPAIEDQNAKAAIRHCARSVPWKKEVDQFCKCSTEAGIGGLSSYCGMLNIMG